MEMDRRMPLPQAPRGRPMWRTLEELRDNPAARAGLGEEFPADATEAPGDPARRTFMKLMAASMALAGAATLSGCGDFPPEQIVPYAHDEPRVAPGLPLFFATALTRCGRATGVLVESHMGRPTKIEGNPDHPASLGATDAITQADILTLYDPDRSQTVRRGEEVSTWELFTAELNPRLAGLRKRGGRGLRILTSATTSPTLADQLGSLLKKLPAASWHRHEPADDGAAAAGAALAAGRAFDAIYRFDEARVIVSLDADFLTNVPGGIRYIRDFASRRHLRGEAGDRAMNRLYVAEPSPTVTGANADHRLPAARGDIPDLAVALAAELGLAIEGSGGGGVPASAGLTAIQRRWISAAANDLRQQRGASIVLAGPAQPPWVHALALAINAYLENVGKSVVAIEPVEATFGEGPGTLAELSTAMAAGDVDALIIVNSNPAYDAPADLDFAARLAAVPFTVHMGLYNDETAALCTWHLPLAHELESWGDARAYDGTASIIQPLIAPLYEGRTAHDLIGLLADTPAQPPYDAVRTYWRSRAGAAGEQGFDPWWRDALRKGVVPGTASAAVPITLDPVVAAGAALQARRQSAAADAAGPNTLELTFDPHPFVYDGRYANNGWLQELSHPISKLTWDNALYLSPAAAERLRLSNEDLVRITHEPTGRTIEAPVWIQPGQAESSASLALGYGHTRFGRVADGQGVNAYAIRLSSTSWRLPAVRVVKTGRTYPLASTQGSRDMDAGGAGSEIVRTGILDEFLADPGLSERSAGKDIHLSFFPAFKFEGQQWGMAIDLTACIGCGACTAACYAENNIPVVGKDQVRRGRDMQWIRVDRYFQGPADNPAMYHQPVPCMHCENAPCELVCPTGATQHSADGLNEMIYNRCIGTRYCSNNCPYKVRRFNFLRYVDPSVEVAALGRNPDVSVRTRGVMEKCTYCVQRIREGMIEAEKESRPVRDGEVKTACQQVCPAEAIVFGDINDPGSKVAAAKRRPHNYALLGELNTRPRTTYLAAIRNPNPALLETASSSTAGPGSPHEAGISGVERPKGGADVH
jgi:MoCo/4Fe-4S cofactor protein with predicted Tat translocation signal